MWNKINHGGNPTPNKDKKYAIFVGRYQPYHFGHCELVEQKLGEGIPCLIMVRNIEPDDTNPFTTQQTVDMIEKYHNSKGHDVLVMVIPDIESVNYGRGVGYEINQYTPPADIAFISATKIREAIKNNDDSWKEMVDESIQEDVKKYLTDENN
jgi:nicotinamide mononucleotide adenylyltransferase